MKKNERAEESNGHGGAGRAQNHPHRHGCVLRVGRTARQSGTARQAGRGRWITGARCGCGRELRSAQVRRALRDAFADRPAEMPGSDFRQAAVRCLQGDLRSDLRDLRRIHAAHRAVVARRGLPRRHRKPQGHQLGDADRGRDQGTDPRQDRTHRLGRRLLQQVSRQACLGSPQARRALRHHSRNGAGIRRGLAGQKISRRRTCDGQER